MFLRTEGKIGNDYPEKVEWCGPWEVVHGGVWGATAPHSTCHFYCQPCFWTTMLCYINFVLYYKVLVNKNKKRNFFFLMGEIGFHVTREKIFAYLCTPPFLYVRLSLLNSTEVI